MWVQVFSGNLFFTFLSICLGSFPEKAVGRMKEIIGKVSHVANLGKEGRFQKPKARTGEPAEAKRIPSRSRFGLA